MGRLVMCSRNLPDLVNLPRQMPREVSFSRSVCVRRRMLAAIAGCRTVVRKEVVVGGQRKRQWVGDGTRGGQSLQKRTYRHGQVRDRQPHVVHPVLMYPEDISIGVGRVVKRRDQVLEGVPGLFLRTGVSACTKGRWKYSPCPAWGRSFSVGLDALLGMGEMGGMNLRSAPASGRASASPAL